MSLPDILQWLSQGGQSGTLVLDNGEVEKSIFFREGVIIASASTDPREFLGHFLVSHGFISEDELGLAISMQDNTKMLLGKILIRQGAITEEDLNRMLMLKSEESIYGIFTWTEGSFRFLDGQLPAYEMVPISLDVTGLLLEGMQRIDEWQRIRARIPSFEAIPVAVCDLLDDRKLSNGERQVLAQIDDQKSVEEICLHTHSSEFFVCRIIFEVAEKGKIKVVKPRSATAVAASPTTSAEALSSRASDLLGEGECELAYRHLKAASSLEPYDRQIQETVHRLEGELRKRLESEGVLTSAVPCLQAGVDATKLSLSPQEGFVFSRINGVADAASIVKISPLPALDALLVFWKLHKAGFITL